MSPDKKVPLPLSPPSPPHKPGSGVRARVIRRFRKLAPVAVIAAAPVLNTACDPAPEPYCSEGDPADWVANLTASAAFIDDGAGGLKIQLTLTLQDAYAYLDTTSFVADGGTIDTMDGTSAEYNLTLTPNTGVTEMKVTGQLGCDGYPSPFEIALSWTGQPVAGDKVTATVTATSAAP